MITFIGYNSGMIVIGIGSNIGARDSMLDAAVARLAPILSGLRASTRYETPALLKPGSPPEWDVPFLNMAVAGECDLPPMALLAALKNIEQEMGRQDRGRWAPREIDLDILCYHEVELATPELTVPHVELLLRYFALAPLVDVAPELVIRGKTAKAWLEENFP